MVKTAANRFNQEALKVCSSAADFQVDILYVMSSRHDF